MGIGNVITGTRDILVGYYPELRGPPEIARKFFTYFGIVSITAELLSGPSDYLMIAIPLYLAGRFGPHLRGYREELRF